MHTIASTRLDHGGTSRSVPALCDGLVRSGVDAHLVTGISSKSPVPFRMLVDFHRSHGVPQSRILPQFRLGKGFQRVLGELSSTPDGYVVLHDHGLWLPTNHSVARYARECGIRRVVSPRGMMSDWALSRRKMLKFLMWRLYQKYDLATATAFHATSEEEANCIREQGFTQPVIVIPNGVEFPSLLPPKRSSIIKQVLCLSRIHPVKGLINLVKAWAMVQPSREWKLLLVGPDEGGHRLQLERCIAELGIAGSVTIGDPVDDVSKWDLLVNSTLFVLPSFTENFGIAVAEAMTAGLPVITTTGTPWQILQEKQIGWWVAPSVDGIVDALKQALATQPAKLSTMGQAGQHYVRETCSWDSVATRFSEFYMSLGQVI